MKIKLTYFTLFILFATKTFSQEKSVQIKGQLQSETNKLEDIHIFNISKSLGVISNDDGSFELPVSENDTLYISSLQYEKISVQITKNNIEAKQLIITLNPLVNELDEMYLKLLTGSLRADMASSPKDTIPKMGYVYKTSDLYKTPTHNEFEGAAHPNAQAITDPLGPIGGGVGLRDRSYEALLKQKRELKLKKEFPEKLKNEFGISYFTFDLKIPEDQINNFISYCEYQNIFEKYYSNKVLEVIQILKEESKNYHENKN